MYQVKNAWVQTIFCLILGNGGHETGAGPPNGDTANGHLIPNTSDNSSSCSNVGLEKNLGLVSGTALIVGTMIGSIVI